MVEEAERDRDGLDQMRGNKGRLVAPPRCLG